MALPVNVDAIPEEMKALKNWVLWKYEDRKNNKREIKKTKVPYQVNGMKAESTTPKTWGSFDNVIKTLDRFPDKYDGLGFIFSLDTGIMGLDFDHVKDQKTGEWNQKALEEIKSLNSYTEISPSGEGAHVMVKGMVPLKPDKDGKTGTGKNNQELGREMYHSGRFFTVTGNVMNGAPTEIKQAQGAINALYYKWFKDDKRNAGSKQQPEKKIKLSDSEVIDIANRAKNSDKFKSLYNGNISGYKSQSEADQALCSLIAFYTQDPGQIDSIFRGSGLYRADKWEVANYRDRTINKALQGVTETYNPENKGKGKSGNGSREEIKVYFDEVADQILKDYHIFSMRDNGQIYLYQRGVYRNEGTEAILGTQIRNVYRSMYAERWKETNPDFDLPEHIPKATAKYVTEVLAYIRAYTHITRDSLEGYQAQYINFSNCLFNLDTWKTEDHRPEIKTICQIPVDYNKDAKCPIINNFLKSVVAEPDIYFSRIPRSLLRGWKTSPITVVK